MRLQFKHSMFHQEVEPCHDVYATIEATNTIINHIRSISQSYLDVKQKTQLPDKDRVDTTDIGFLHGAICLVTMVQFNQFENTRSISLAHDEIC